MTPKNTRHQMWHGERTASQRHPALRGRLLFSELGTLDSTGIAFCTAAIVISLCGIVGLYTSMIVPDRGGRILLFCIVVLPAIRLAAVRSTLLLDTFFIIVVCNRLLRRLLDWGEGQFDNLPLLSITPLVVAVLMLPLIFERWDTLPRSMRQGGLLLVGGLIFSALVGVGNGMAAIFACGDYSTPLIVLFWCVAMRPTPRTVNRWMIVLATLGLLAAIYGIVQWAIVPPWDARWVLWSGMWSSMGNPVPYQLAIASTLESRGPAAWFFAHIIAITVAVPATRRPWGFIIPSICIFALLLTTVRTGVIYATLSLLLVVLLARRGGRWRVILPILIVTLATVAAVRSMSQTSSMGERLSTLADIQNDSSAQGRVQIAQQGLMNVLAKPLGYGLGSGGIANRVNVDATGAVGDNGYLELLSTLGVPGFTLYALGIVTISRPLFQRKPSMIEPAGILGRAMLIALLPSMLVFNCLIGPHASYVWVLLASEIARPTGGMWNPTVFRTNNENSGIT